MRLSGGTEEIVKEIIVRLYFCYQNLDRSVHTCCRNACQTSSAYYLSNPWNWQFGQTIVMTIPSSKIPSMLKSSSLRSPRKSQLCNALDWRRSLALTMKLRLLRGLKSFGEPLRTPEISLESTLWLMPHWLPVSCSPFWQLCSKMQNFWNRSYHSTSRLLVISTNIGSSHSHILRFSFRLRVQQVWRIYWNFITQRLARTMFLQSDSFKQLLTPHNPSSGREG